MKRVESRESRVECRKLLIRCSRLSTLDSRLSAFSLTEVVLAIAIVSLAVVGVMTAFPIGINASRDARDENVIALITEDIFATMRSSPFNQCQILEQGGNATVDLTDTAAPGGKVYETTSDKMFYYSADGRPSRSLTGIGAPPGLNDSYRSEEGYFGVKVTVVNNPYYAIPGLGGSLPISKFLDASGKASLAKVIVDVSWPARAPLTPKDTRKHNIFVSYLANLN